MKSIHIARLSGLSFFFNDTATTEIYTLSLHDALPISLEQQQIVRRHRLIERLLAGDRLRERSEEHTSELQSQSNLVCRLLLEKKKDWSRRRASPLPPRACAGAAMAIACAPA